MNREDEENNQTDAAVDNGENSPKRPASFTWLMVMLALFSVCVTLLIVLGMWRKRANALQATNFANSIEHTRPEDIESRPLDLSQFTPIRPFELTDHQGQPFTSKSLEGKWWLASFVFSSCPQICPELTRNKADLRKQINQALGDKADTDKLQYISFSVDPETDQPETLKAFAKLHGALHSDWIFLTGDKTKIWSICQQDFHLPVADSPDVSQIITHSTRVVLVDPAGKIRGYYDPKVVSSRKTLLALLVEQF